MDIRDRVRGVLAKTLMVDHGRAHDGALLVEDLGVSSLDRFELIMGLEEEFGLEIQEQDLVTVKTVGDIIDYIDGKTKEPERNY